MESESNDMVPFSSGGQIKGKRAYLWSSHVAGQSGSKTASEQVTALMGRLDRGQLHRCKPQEKTHSNRMVLHHPLCEAQQYNAIISRYSSSPYFKNGIFVSLWL